MIFKIEKVILNDCMKNISVFFICRLMEPIELYDSNVDPLQWSGAVLNIMNFCGFPLFCYVGNAAAIETHKTVSIYRIYDSYSYE